MHFGNHILPLAPEPRYESIAIPQTMASLGKRVGNQWKKFAVHFANLLKEIVSVAQDHVKLWELGLTLTLKIPSWLFIAPFTVTTTEDGLRKLLVRSSRSGHCIFWMFNIIVVVRLACYVSNCLDPNFRWLYEGKFTADAVAFNVGLTLASAAYLLHLMLLHYKEDLVFLCNSAIKLNKRFSGNVEYSLFILMSKAQPRGTIHGDVHKFHRKAFGHP